MSAEAITYVKRFSPFTGTTYWLHFVLADLANYQHGYRIFVSDRTLCEEYPFKRTAISQGRAKLIDGGYLRLAKRASQGHPAEYLFVFLGHEGMAHGAGIRTRTRSDSEHVLVRKSQGVLLPTKEGTKESQNLAPLVPEKPTDDPLVATAHALAKLAYEQPVTPSTRGGFATVLKRIESELRAHTPPAAIAAAIESGDVTWTADGLRTAISKAKPRKNPLSRGGPSLKSQFASVIEQERKLAAGGRRNGHGVLEMGEASEPDSELTKE